MHAWCFTVGESTVPIFSPILIPMNHSPDETWYLLGPYTHTCRLIPRPPPTFILEEAWGTRLAHTHSCRTKCSQYSGLDRELDSGLNNELPIYTGISIANPQALFWYWETTMTVQIKNGRLVLVSYPERGLGMYQSHYLWSVQMMSSPHQVTSQLCCWVIWHELWPLVIKIIVQILSPLLST